MTMYGQLSIVFSYIYINQSLEKKIQLESKLDFAFVSFPNKLNCLVLLFFL